MESQAAEQVWLDRPWGRLSVWRSGTGPTVCAIHGLGGSGRYWGGLARQLAPSRTLLAPDLPGFGQSDKPALRYDRQFHLAEIENLIDTIGSNEPIVMIGHSAGAVLAALWVARHPERAGGLAMVSAPFPHPGLMPDIAKRVADRPPADRGTVAPIVARVLWPILSRIAIASRRFPADVVSDFGRQSLGARADTMWSLLADVSVIEEIRPLAGLPRVDSDLASLRGRRPLCRTTCAQPLAPAFTKRRDGRGTDRWTSVLVARGIRSAGRLAELDPDPEPPFVKFSQACTDLCRFSALYGQKVDTEPLKSRSGNARTSSDERSRSVLRCPSAHAGCRGRGIHRRL